MMCPRRGSMASSCSVAAVADPSVATLDLFRTYTLSLLSSPAGSQAFRSVRIHALGAVLSSRFPSFLPCCTQGAGLRFFSRTEGQLRRIRSSPTVPEGPSPWRSQWVTKTVQLSLSVYVVSLHLYGCACLRAQKLRWTLLPMRQRLLICVYVHLARIFGDVLPISRCCIYPSIYYI